MDNMNSTINKEINMDFMIDERIKRLFKNSMCYYYEGCYNYVEPFAKGLQLMSTEAYDETFGRFRDYCGEILFEGITCQNCGENNNPSNHYCPKCGTQLSDKLICNNCNFPLGANTSYCKNCGNKVI
jgi:hypothetical protein